MKRARRIILLGAVAMFASAAMAEPGPSVLRQIPAESAGYAVINNVRASAADVDQLIKDVGLNKMMPMPPGGVLTILKGVAALGPGFNADGGMALAVLDPKKFDLDVVAMLRGGPDAKQPKPSDFPVLLFIPGSSVKGVFGALVRPAGKYDQILLPLPFPIIATHRNGYVIASPCPAALEAVVGAKKSAADELSKEHAALIAKSDLALHVNVKVIEPIVNDIWKMAQEMDAQRPADSDDGGEKKQTFSLAAYGRTLDEAEAATMTVDIGKTGVSVHLMVSSPPDCVLAKAAAAFSGKVKPSVARLPNMPYALAVGGVIDNSVEGQESLSKLSAKLNGVDLFKELGDRLAEARKATHAEVTGFQLVVGGAPKGKGALAVAALLECKDPKSVKATLAKLPEIIESIIKAVKLRNKEAEQLKVGYSKGVATVDTITVDAITFDHPKLSEMKPRQLKDMRKLLGEENILIRVAAIDDRTVAMTLGGSEAFLSETIKAARLGGRIRSRKDVKTQAKYIPERPTGFVLINMGNLVEIANTFAQTVNPAVDALDKISTKDPVILSAGYTGKAAHLIAHLPTVLIKEAIVAAVSTSDDTDDKDPIPPGDDF